MPDTAQSFALPEFCATVLNRYASAWPPTEHQLAQDFLAHFGTARFGFYDGLVKWCGEVGIEMSTMDCLPHDMRGGNFWHEQNMSIVLPLNGGCLISREHTLLHELRELLEHTFKYLGHPIADGDAHEQRADEFAACVRIAILMDSSKDFFRIANDVRDPLGRACAYALVGAMTLAAVVGCAGVRQLEAHFEARQSNCST